MSLRVHAICLALNEQMFIRETLKVLYPFCSGISVLTQYDRDWYGKAVVPDNTTSLVLNFPDPEGKIHLVVRRWRDQAAALNSEMLALISRPGRKVSSHGTPIEEIRAFHAPPDYFLIVDADEIYDSSTLGKVLSYLEQKRPRGMRMSSYNYVRDWNHRVPTEVVRFVQFGFVKAGLLFEHIRQIDWNESRLAKLLTTARLPDFSSRLWGFIECPEEVGVFHHGCWLGDDTRLKNKMIKSAHQIDEWRPEFIQMVEELPTVLVPTGELPLNIQQGEWPSTFFASEGIS